MVRHDRLRDAWELRTGPFREVEYVASDHYTVEANADYWGEDKLRPYVREILERAR